MTSVSPKSLSHLLPKHSGRDNRGTVSVRHQGGRHKRFYRTVDFYRRSDVVARVDALEYDPNRHSQIALLTYQDGQKSYILAPDGLKVGAQVISKSGADVNVGNTLPLSEIPVGTLIHNIELTPGKGGKMVRAAGVAAMVLAKEGAFIQVKFPSGEIRRIPGGCLATIGQVSNIDWRHHVLGKAGASRHRGIRPTVRGVAQNPRTHPHGGGEGRSGIGMPSPKSPWGKRTLGKKTRRLHRYSESFIVSRRKK
jgi:large subunit ribosomal protein L2